MDQPLERRIAVAPAARAGRLGQLLSVAGWELRHFSATPASWGLAGAGLFFFIALTAVRNMWGPLVGTTVLGQLAELVYNLMLVFGVMLPFLVTDRAAHDVQQRMHELVMAADVPSWVYVWGRYLAALVVGLGLALLVPLAQGLVNAGLSALNPAQFPVPSLTAMLSFWAAVTLPASISVGSLCYCLGTLLPRLTALPKLAVCTAWLILAFDQDPTDLTWRAYWNPSGAGLVTLQLDRFQRAAQAAGQAADLLRLQQIMPNLAPWLGPLWALAGLGVLLAALTAIAFRRYTESL